MARPFLQPLTHFPRTHCPPGPRPVGLHCPLSPGLCRRRTRRASSTGQEATVVGLVLDVPSHGLPAQPAHRELRVLAGHGQPLLRRQCTVYRGMAPPPDSHRAGGEELVGVTARGVVDRPRMDFQTCRLSCPDSFTQGTNIYCGPHGVHLRFAAGRGASEGCRCQLPALHVLHWTGLGLQPGGLGTCGPCC